MEAKFDIGQEIEAYCERCRLNLNCTISAMDEDQIKQVECRTCGNFVRYRPPVDESARKQKMLERVLRMRDKKRQKRPPNAPRSSMNADPRWVEMTEGVNSTWAVPYRAERMYEEGDFVLHKRFGLGYVDRQEKEKEIAVLFREGVIFLPVDQPIDE